MKLQKVIVELGNIHSERQKISFLLSGFLFFISSSVTGYDLLCFIRKY